MNGATRQRNKLVDWRSWEHIGDWEKPGATPPSHRMFCPFLGTNATAWSASPRSKRGSVLAVKGERRGRSTEVQSKFQIFTIWRALWTLPSRDSISGDLEKLVQHGDAGVAAHV